MKNNRRLFYVILVACLVNAGILMNYLEKYVQTAEARTEQILDNTNNNLKISVETSNSWNSGTISETISKLNWRLNGLNAVNGDGSAFFAIANLPSLANFALPLGQKTGLLSLLLSQYVTINREYDITLRDGSSGHKYSISATADQLHKVNIPINQGLEAVLITTQQRGITYVIAYATHLGRMGEFEGIFQNILNSVRFGSSSPFC